MVQLQSASLRSQTQQIPVWFLYQRQQCLLATLLGQSNRNGSSPIDAGDLLSCHLATDSASDMSAQAAAMSTAEVITVRKGASNTLIVPLCHTRPEILISFREALL